MSVISALVARAVAAAATITGKKFALMVASSLVATTGIIAAALTTSSSDLGPLAAVLGQRLAAQQAPVATEPGAEPDAVAAEPAGRKPDPAPDQGVTPSPAPLAEPAPVEASPAPEPEAEPEPERESKDGAPAEAAVEAGPVQHIFLISLASLGFEAAWGVAPQMPYLAGTLRPQGTLLSSYKMLEETPLANGIAAISGQRPNPMTKADCPNYVNFPPGAGADRNGIVSGSGCIYPVETLSLADQLAGEQLRWHAYMEDMVGAAGAPENCVTPEPEGTETAILGGYSARLNPFVYFHSLLDLGDCATNDVPLSELERDLRKVETTPNFSYISPNLCNAGTVGQCPAGAPQGAPVADEFLADWVPKILRSPAYKEDGLIVISFNQVSPPPLDPASSQPVPPAAEPLKVGALLLSRFGSPGAVDGSPYTPYSLLRSFEDLFRLDRLAGAAPNKVRSFAALLEGRNGGD